MKKIATLSSLIILASALVGCASQSAADIAQQQRQQLLDAQMSSITVVNDELAHIRQGNGGDMSKWSPDTIALYKQWQTILDTRAQERERLIQQLQGNTLSGMTGNGVQYSK